LLRPQVDRKPHCRRTGRPAKLTMRRLLACCERPRHPEDHNSTDVAGCRPGAGPGGTQVDVASSGDERRKTVAAMASHSKILRAGEYDIDAETADVSDDERVTKVLEVRDLLTTQLNKVELLAIRASLLTNDQEASDKVIQKASGAGGARTHN